MVFTTMTKVAPQPGQQTETNYDFDCLSKKAFNPSKENIHTKNVPEIFAEESSAQVSIAINQHDSWDFL